MSEMNKKAIHIEIEKSWKKDCWNIRTGDITGSTECLNINKKELIQEIKDQINQKQKEEE